MNFELSVKIEAVVVLVALASARAHLLPNSVGGGTGECESSYLRFSPDHVMCKQHAGACRIITSGINNTDKDIILNLHNRYRSHIAFGNISGLPPASDMLEMEWDDDLARVAQAHANLCTGEPVCSECIKIEKFPFVGRVGCRIHTDSEDQNGDWRECIRSIYEEASNIPPAVLDSPVRMTRGAERLSQLAWAKSWRVGCGFAIHPFQRSSERFVKQYTCAYGPGGNVRSKDVYKVGEACSDCPEGTCCGSSCGSYGLTPSFEGLCKVVGDGPAAAIDKEDLLWSCQFNRDTQRACRARNEPADVFLAKRFFASGYAEAVLQGGQSAEITFEQLIRPVRGSLCVVVDYEKGPNVAGQPDRGILELVVTPVERPERQRTINLSGSSALVISTRISLRITVPVQIGFTFVVPAEGPSQYVNIRSVAVYVKACS